MPPCSSLLTKQDWQLQASRLLSIGTRPCQSQEGLSPSGAQWLWCLRWHTKSRPHLDTQRAAAAPQGALKLELGEMSHHRTNKEGSEREKEKHPHKCSQTECRNAVPRKGGAGAVLGVGRVTHQTSFRGLEKQRSLDPGGFLWLPFPNDRPHS